MKKISSGLDNGKEPEPVDLSKYPSPTTKHPIHRQATEPQDHRGAPQDLVTPTRRTYLGPQAAKPIPQEGHSPVAGAIKDIYKVGDGIVGHEGTVTVLKGGKRQVVSTQSDSAGTYYKDDSGNKHYIG